MVCIYCSGKTSVINSRPQKRLNSVWRRRKCQKCNAICTSVESVDMEASVLVTKPAGHTEAFSRDKLLISLYDSLKHRKTSVSDATALSGTVIGRIVSEIDTPVIEEKRLTSIVLNVLENFDPVSSVHYRAYYVSP